MTFIKYIIAFSVGTMLHVGVGHADDVGVSVGNVGGNTVPGTPNPPQNPAQDNSALGGKGVIVTYPKEQPPTTVICTRDGKQVPC